MSRILATWEMGAGLGHLDRLIIIGRALRARGHEVAFVLRDLQHAWPRIVKEGFRVGQAPIRLPRPLRVPFVGNYTAVLAAAGWLDAEGLAGQLCGWQTWLDELRPDLMIADHSPTAVLATRGRGLPIWVIGNSFQVPPKGECFPPILHWVESERRRSAQYDAMVLPHANQALVHVGGKPLDRLTDLFAGTSQAIVSIPELAHYTGYDETVSMVGPSYLGDGGIDAEWPRSMGPRVFAYLDSSHPRFIPLMRTLNALGWPSVVFARGLAPDDAARLSSASLSLHLKPLRVKQSVAKADLVITHASIGTVSAAALAGKVQFAIPSQSEQWMVGHRIAGAGIGLSLGLSNEEVDFAGLLQRLVDDGSFADAACQLASRHAGESPERSGERIAGLVTRSLGS